jgi:hypothetical protein
MRKTFSESVQYDNSSNVSATNEHRGQRNVHNIKSRVRKIPALQIEVGPPSVSSRHYVCLEIHETLLILCITSLNFKPVFFIESLLEASKEIGQRDKSRET